MWRNLIDVTLVGCVVYLGWLIVIEKGMLAPINEDLGRLQAMAGDFRIVSPDKIYIKAITTGRPLEFMWRVYWPKGYEPGHAIQFIGMGGSSSSTRSSRVPPARDFVLRARLRVDSESVYFQSRGNQSGSQSGAPLRDSNESRSVRRLAEDPDRAVIKQAGADRVEEYTVADEIMLLSVSVNQDGPDSKPVEVLTYKYFGPRSAGPLSNRAR